MCTYAGELPVRKGAFGYLSRGERFPGDGNKEPPGDATRVPGRFRRLSSAQQAPAWVCCSLCCFRS